MPLTQSKQINKPLQAWVGIAAFSAVGGTSDTITTPLTSALNTAGAGGAAVPLQVGSTAQGPTTQMGVNTTPPFNITAVYAAGTKDVLLDGNGQEVYGKFTNSGSTWTLSYFSVVGTTETAYTMPPSTSIDFEVPYVFSFELFPPTGVTGATQRHISPDPAAFAGRTQPDALTVTAANTLSPLSKTYAGPWAQLIVNGIVYTNFGSTPPFSVSGTAVTWSASNAGFPLATTDEVKAIYGY